MKTATKTKRTKWQIVMEYHKLLTDLGTFIQEGNRHQQWVSINKLRNYSYLLAK